MLVHLSAAGPSGEGYVRQLVVFLLRRSLRLLLVEMCLFSRRELVAETTPSKKAFLQQGSIYHVHSEKVIWEERGSS